jgi:hypothetical protein
VDTWKLLADGIAGVLGASDAVPFYGSHLAGIVTPAQD